MRTYNLSDTIAKLLIVSQLKNKAIAWFHSKPEHIKLNSDELLKKLRLMFFRRIEKIKVRKQFENRIWKKNGNFSKYVHDKVILANKVPINEAEIIDY